MNHLQATTGLSNSQIRYTVNLFLLLSSFIGHFIPTVSPLLIVNPPKIVSFTYKTTIPPRASEERIVTERISKIEVNIFVDEI